MISAFQFLALALALFIGNELLPRFLDFVVTVHHRLERLTPSLGLVALTFVLEFAKSELRRVLLELYNNPPETASVSGMVNALILLSEGVEFVFRVCLVRSILVKQRVGHRLPLS